MEYIVWNFFLKHPVFLGVTHCVISPNVDAHGQAFIWVYPCTGCVQTQLSHWNSHPIHPQVSKTQYSFSISDDNSLIGKKNKKSGQIIYDH